MAPEYGGNSHPAITTGAATMPAGTSANLWNLSPDERAGQPEERLVTVTLCIAPHARFFQLEIGGVGQYPRDIGLTRSQYCELDSKLYSAILQVKIRRLSLSGGIGRHAKT